MNKLPWLEWLDGKPNLVSQKGLLSYNHAPMHPCVRLSPIISGPSLHRAKIYPKGRPFFVAHAIFNGSRKGSLQKGIHTAAGLESLLVDSPKKWLLQRPR